MFMRATLQGVTQMGKSRPGATALRQHVQSLLQGGVGGPLSRMGVFAREDDGRLCPAPHRHRGRWGPLPVWTGVRGQENARLRYRHQLPVSGGCSADHRTWRSASADRMRRVAPPRHMYRNDQRERALGFNAD